MIVTSSCVLYSSLLFQVKIWFQNRRTKWKKIDNISNAEAAEHKNHTPTKEPSSKAENVHSKMRIYSKQMNQSSNSSLESDSKSSSAATTDTGVGAKTFKDILHTSRLSFSPDNHFQAQMDTAKDVLLNLSFNVTDKS